MERLTRIVLPGLVVLAVYYSLFGGQHSTFELAQAREDRVEATEALARLQQENDSLRARADSLTNDPRVLERFAREEFRMIREGEVLVIFAEDESPEASDGRSRPAR